MSVASYVTTSVNRIYLFNELGGQFDNVDSESIKNQAERVMEEVKEIFEEGLYVYNDEKLLKETVDSFVTVVGALLKLEAAGFKVSEAMSRVDLNNLSKFPKLSDSKLDDIIAHAKAKGWNISKREDHGVLVLTDENKKIRKPLTFQDITVGDCAVAGFLRETY